MQTRMAYGIMLTLCMLSLMFEVQQVEAAVIYKVYIRADGSIDPPTANIASDDNVTYYLTDNIECVWLIYGIHVDRDDIVIDGRGYTIQGMIGGLRGIPDRFVRGISLSGRRNVTIKNMEIIEFCYWIYLSNSVNISIYGNNLSESYPYGIYLRNSSYCSISGNHIITTDYISWISGGSGTCSHGCYNNISGNLIEGDKCSPRILSPQNQTYTTSSVPLNCTRYLHAYSLDGQENIIVNGNQTLSGLSNGLHNITVYTKISDNTYSSNIRYFSVLAEVIPFPFEWVIIAIVGIVVVGGITGFMLYRKRRHK